MKQLRHAFQFTYSTYVMQMISYHLESDHLLAGCGAHVHAGNLAQEQQVIFRRRPLHTPVTMHVISANSVASCPLTHKPLQTKGIWNNTATMPRLFKIKPVFYTASYLLASKLVSLTFGKCM
jgi:hypothetical protein